MGDRGVSRRAFLTGSAGLAAAVALSKSFRLGSAGQELIEEAASVRPAGSNLSSIKHLIFLVQENRSFDNYFGAMGGVNGFGGFNPSSPVWSQACSPSINPDGHLWPFHLDTAKQDAECTYDLTHSWAPQHACWNGGAMDSFAATHTSNQYEGMLGELTMGYYDSTDIPFYWDLARKFTICDGYFSSVMGPTHPNRLMQISGSLDPHGTAGGPVLVTNGSPSSQFTCSWKTMPELLTEHGVSWKFYNPYGGLYQPGPNGLDLWLSDNILMYFQQFQQSNNAALFEKAFGFYGPAVKGGITSKGSPNDFKKDVRAGTLPAVSWIVTPDGFDEHPPAPPVLGEWFTAQIIKDLMSNKEVWASSALFITYDENDGWFDHVPPVVPPGGTDGEYLTVDPLPASAGGIAGPIGLGFRVPMIVVSPFSVSSFGARTGTSGWVCSDLLDHTSQLKLIERLFLPSGTIMGAGGLPMSQWRYDTVGDLSGALPLATGSPRRPRILAVSPSTKRPPISTECTPNQLIERNPTTSVYPVPSPQVAPVQGSQTFVNTGI